MQQRLVIVISSIGFPEFVRNRKYLNPRSSRLLMFFKSGVLKNFANFTGKHFNSKHNVDLKTYLPKKTFF